MPEPLKSSQENEPITSGEQLGVFAFIMVLIFSSLFLFICLGDHPYGVQCATAVSYSGVVFVYTFFRTRGMNTKHDLSASYVHEQMPRLLLIHAAYLIVIFVLQALAFDIRPSMPSWWLIRSGPKDGPPFGTLSILIIMAIGISQIIISRRILGRAKKEHLLRTVSQALHLGPTLAD